MARNGFIILTFFCVYVSAVQLPSFVKLCHKNDPNLSKCFVNNANDVIPKIAEGSKELGQMPLNPFVVPKVKLNGGDNFVLTFYQLKTYGLEKSLIQDGAKIDLENGEFALTATAPLIVFDGDYEINGQILVLPINGKGRGTIKFHEPTLFLTAKFDYEDKGGKKYMKLERTAVDYKVKKVDYHFENLFNGDEKLGIEMNKVLNDNWEIVNRDLYDAAVAAMKATLDQLILNYFTKIPFDSIYPD